MRVPVPAFSLRRHACLLALPALTIAWSVPAASAFIAAPGWQLHARTYPTNLSPGGSGMIEVEVYNVGAGDSKGTVTVTDTLPSGVSAADAGELAHGELFEEKELGHLAWNCTGNGPGPSPNVNGATSVTCTNSESGMPSIPGGGATHGVFLGETEKGGAAPLAITVNVAPNAAGVEGNHVAIQGGGAALPASVTNPIILSPATSSFGVVGWDGFFSNADGTPDTQAGSHPYLATFNLDLASGTKASPFLPSGGEVRDIEVRLPPGLIGDPTAVPQCTRQEFDSESGSGQGGCGLATQVGLLATTFGGNEGGKSTPLKVFNMVPPPGVPAEFGARLEGQPVLFVSNVRTGGDKGITTHIDSAPQRGPVSSTLILWGVPADASHNRWRSAEPKGCVEGKELEHGMKEACTTGAPLRPFLTLPTGCPSPPPVFSMRANSWQEPSAWSKASFMLHDANGVPSSLSGCEDLGFGPAITNALDTAMADTATGFTFEVAPPLGGLDEPEGLGSADVQATTVTLPEGLVVNPGQAAGLQACEASQDALTTPSEELEGKENDGPAHCPAGSEVGTVEVKSPLLEAAEEKELKGHVYVLRSNPPDIKLLLTASADGVNVKEVVEVHLDEATGRVTAIATGIAQLPFSDFKLSFSSGPRAALDTPPRCGTYTTSAVLTSWAQPFVANFPTNAAVAIVEGANSTACPALLPPFRPSLIAGTSTDQAGGFASLSLLVQRGDGEQRVDKLQVETPPGLAGMISRVPPCQEPQAAAGTCPASSHIGHAIVTSGPGAYPLLLPQPNEPEFPIYLTGPYQGAPFGLSIVAPVLAGPFNLGTIVTRARVEVDEHSAQVRVATDSLPQVVKGVPSDLRTIRAVVDRSGFIFNPTNCSAQGVSGVASSIDGTVAPLSSPFQVGSCQSLKFAPKISMSTGARYSRLNGASLSIKISYPPSAMGSESWFDEVKLDIPKQLPARLDTLQKACIVATFEADPERCPPGSRIGRARVHTPVLPVPLVGTVFFVSHGGGKFPDVVIVLKGDGVVIDLVGETFIRGGITSATFRHTPDVPFESIEVSIPTGRFSEFAGNLPAKAHESFCGQKLTTPTLLKAQNGLAIHQNTAIAVTGCPRATKHRAGRRRSPGRARPRR